MKTLTLLEEDYYSNSYSKSLNSVLSKILREPLKNRVMNEVVVLRNWQHCKEIYGIVPETSKCHKEMNSQMVRLDNKTFLYFA